MNLVYDFLIREFLLSIIVFCSLLVIGITFLLSYRKRKERKGLLLIGFIVIAMSIAFFYVFLLPTLIAGEQHYRDSLNRCQTEECKQQLGKPSIGI